MSETIQELHRELMVLKADYDDLSRKMDNWSERFFKLYCKSNNKLNGEKENSKPDAGPC